MGTNPEATPTHPSQDYLSAWFMEIRSCLFGTISRRIWEKANEVEANLKLRKISLTNAAAAEERRMQERPSLSCPEREELASEQSDYSARFNPHWYLRERYIP